MNIQPAQSSAIYSPAAREASAAQAAQPEKKDAAPARAAAPDYDEYVPEDKAGLEHSGYYEPVSGGDGPGLRFDAPEDEAPAADGGGKPSDKAEQTTTNTDRVDRELEKLRAEREKLGSRLRTASGAEAEKLQKRLSRLENELRQKDNDAYRRAHAVIS